MKIHDSLSSGKNFLGTLSYKLIKDKLFRGIVFLYRRNRREINNLLLAGTRRIQINAKDRNIARGHRLFLFFRFF